MIADLLDAVLPEDGINHDASIRTAKGFAQRYGLASESPLIRLRILDPACAVSSLRDLTVPLSDLRQLDLPIDIVFITENKINGLCFPDVPRAIVIFGLGYGVESLKAIRWLKHKRLYYWGDIDSHGFRILDQLRAYYPEVRSMLMDQDTLRDHLLLCVEEPNDNRYTGDLHRLRDNERNMFVKLLENDFGNNLRLEQERIRFSRVETFLKRVSEGRS